MDYSYGSQAFLNTFAYPPGHPHNRPDVVNWTSEEPIFTSPPQVASALKENKQYSFCYQLHSPFTQDEQWQGFLHPASSSSRGWTTMPSQYNDPGVNVGRQSSADFSGLSTTPDSVFDNHVYFDQAVRNSQYRSLIAPNMISLPAVAAPMLSSISPGNPYGVRLQSQQPSSSLSKDIRVNLSNADTIFQSTDAAFFYVHADIIHAASCNSFGSFLQSPTVPPTIIKVDVDSTVLNLMIFAVYDTFNRERYVVDDDALPLPVGQDSSLPMLMMTIDVMGRYGLTLSKFVYSSSMLFTELYRHVPFHPLDVYTLAAHHDLSQLAIGASAHLLSLDLRKISFEQSERMGATYYRRLNLLHATRLTHLKEILSSGPPSGHPYDLLCTNVAQRDMRSSWALAIIDVLRNASPDLSPDYFKAQMRSYMETIDCVTCRNQFSAKIEDAALQWSMVAHTI